jgi:hypothetical protein
MYKNVCVTHESYGTVISMVVYSFFYITAFYDNKAKSPTIDQPAAQA